MIAAATRQRDRLAASEWARVALSDERAVILDTETTDLRGYICDIAVIRAIDGEVFVNMLLNPGVPIEPGAQAVHGISDAEVARAPRFAAIVAELQAQLAQRRILVYNAEYDAGRFTAELSRMDAPLTAIGGSWECIMLEYARWVGEWNEYRGSYRRALGDCRAARARLQEMARDGGAP